MANLISQYVSGFNTDIQKQFLIDSKTGVLIPTKKKYDEKFGTVYIRQIKTTGGLANYDKNIGYDGAGGNGTAEWVGYTVDNDRLIDIWIDAMDELPSFLEGTESSISALYNLQINKNLAKEMDALAMARAYAGCIEAGGALETSNFKTDFWGTVIDIKNKYFDEKDVDSDKLIYGFISSEIYAQGEKELLNKNGLANSAVLTKLDMKVPSGIKGSGALEITLNAIKYDNIVLIKMPKDRMSTEITMLDGRSEGQQAGGFLAGDTKMSAVFVPEGVMFTDVQYDIAQFLVPAEVYQNIASLDIAETLKQLTGNLKLDYIGVNQKRNAFEIIGRIRYDSKVIDVHKDKILCFKEA